jgi:1-deoxy-D-xylulose-5-phosphate reductoisomerase
MLQNIAIFGSTGSIGKSTLDVVRLHPDKYKIFALTGYSNYQLLFEQCQEFQPQYVFIQNTNLASQLTTLLKEAKLQTNVLSNDSDLIYLAEHKDVDIVMSAIVGSAGLIPTYYAVKAGKRVLLANKESLVAGGNLVMNTAKSSNATIIPVDSEHSAIFQSLPFGYKSLDDAGVSKIILTASGGPFLNTPKAKLENVTVAQALKHPNWSMGQKITIDSSTLMNKGLEVIEAFWLFRPSNLEQIEVVVHPQSIIHSMVEYSDSSIIAQLGTPDMKTPIAYALSAPNRIESGSSRLDFTQLKTLTFTTPDTDRFPCLKLAWDSLRYGNSACLVLNAANEIAVSRFLQSNSSFYGIPALIEKALAKYASITTNSLDEILALDIEVRQFCEKS